MRTRGLAAVVLMALVLTGDGCADLRHSLGADIALDAEFKAHFRETISVLRVPKGILTVSVHMSQAEDEKVMPGNDRLRALRIAKFARAHYTDTAGLRTIMVLFTTRPDGGGLHPPQSHPVGTWPVAALDSVPGSRVADSAGQSVEGR